MERKWGWFQSRRYRHFDYPISAESAMRLVTNPNLVARHAFYPFISIVHETRRYRPKEHKTKVKPRPIRYACHADSAIFSYYAKMLSDAYESRIRNEPFSSSVIAYRKLGGKTNVHFAAEAFADIRRIGDCIAIGMDIKSFFDSLDHAILKREWAWALGVTRLPEDHYAVYRHISRYSYVERKSLDALQLEFPSKGRICDPEVFRKHVRAKGLIRVHDEVFGIPQGSPISAVLANIYMHRLDAAIHAVVERVGGKYLRYADDILLVVPPNCEEVVRNALQLEVEGLRLSISAEKTVRVMFRKTASMKVAVEYPTQPKPEDKRALQYLGFTFDGQRVLVRSSSLARYWRTLKASVHVAKRVAHSHGSAKVFRRKLYRCFSHVGSRNFYTYVRLASEVFGVPFFARQVRRHWRVLQRELSGPG